MMENEKDNPKNESKKKSINSYVKYSSLGFQMIAIILLGTFGGKQLDKMWELESPIFTILLTFAALIMALFYMFRQLLKK